MTVFSYRLTNIDLNDPVSDLDSAAPKTKKNSLYEADVVLPYKCPLSIGLPLV